MCVLREAVHDVGQTLQYHGEFHQSVFLDDRATVVHTPEMAMRFINLWEAWSARLGFEENLTKLQVVCKHDPHADALRAQGLPETALTHTVRVLGADFGSMTNLATILESKRRMTCLTGSTPCRCRPRIRLLLFRTRIIPKLSWGFWWQPVPDCLQRKWTSRLRFVLRVQKKCQQRFMATPLWSLD